MQRLSDKAKSRASALGHAPAVDLAARDLGVALAATEEASVATAVVKAEEVEAGAREAAQGREVEKALEEETGEAAGGAFNGV